MSSTRKRKNKHKKRVPLRVALTVLALALAAAVLLGSVLLIAPLTERVDGRPASGSENWMARLNGETPLNELILPGTRNSAAVFTPRAFFTKCQSLDVGAQLGAGYRMLDLRLGVTERGDGFRLLCDGGVCKTGLFGRELTLDELLAPCYAFLDAHPTETVLLALRLGDDRVSVRSAQLLLDAYIREAPQYWLLTDALPVLDEARGKLVLLRGWEDAIGLNEEAGVPFAWRDQGGFEDLTLSAVPEDQGSYLLWVQDRYEYDAEDKWSTFLNGFRSTEDGAASLNILGTKGESSYGHPYEFAKELNARLMELEGSRLRGWILVDFGSAPLAERIYRLNF